MALIQRSRLIDESGPMVDAFLFTTLLPTAPKILLNVENGDHGRLERRACGCPLGSLGLRDHIIGIQSYEKLSGEGTVFIRSDLVSVIEEVLPGQFGGSSTDYQLLEEQDEHGSARLYLLVSPSVGAVDEAQLKQVFLAGLAKDREREQYVAKIWQRLGTIQVRREVPRVTGMGKTLTFHLAEQRE